MPASTLQRIQTEVRRIARVPDPTLMSDDQINDYVNTFYQFDMPVRLRLFNMREVLTFYTIPNIDTYVSQDINANDDLFDFKNRITAIHPPVFMAGQQGFFTQFRDAFYVNWSQNVFTQDTQLRGNGTTGAFTGTLTGFPILQNNVSFNALDATNNPMIVVDYPRFGDRTTGDLGVQTTAGNPPSLGTISYLTGQFTFNFPNPTLDSGLNIVYANTLPYQPGKPTSMLYYDDMFILRPVPDKVYPITVEADLVPSELLNKTDHPELNQWWQYIALGTCLKIFRSRMAWDDYNALYGEFIDQETMLVSRSDEQQVNMRTQTLITRGKWLGGPWGIGSQGWPY